jgi:hypothetical protein
LLTRFVKVPPPLSQLEHRAGSIPKDGELWTRRAFAAKLLRFHVSWPLRRKSPKVHGAKL